MILESFPGKLGSFKAFKVALKASLKNNHQTSKYLKASESHKTPKVSAKLHEVLENSLKAWRSS
jgi:DNA-binding MurR/RpiR family transcriptional regulator